MPQTIDELRQLIDEQGYELHGRPGPDGGQNDSGLKIEDLFTYTTDSGQGQTFELLEPSGQELLPRITAAGLKPRPTLDWSTRRP